MPDYREEEPPIESTATPVQEPPKPEPQAVAHRAADGGIIPGPTRTVGNFIDMLEDGQLSYEVHEQLKELASNISAVANSTGAKAKGTLTLTLNIEKQGREDALHISGAITIIRRPVVRAAAGSGSAGIRQSTRSRSPTSGRHGPTSTASRSPCRTSLGSSRTISWTCFRPA